MDKMIQETIAFGTKTIRCLYADCGLEIPVKSYSNHKRNAHHRYDKPCPFCMRKMRPDNLKKHLRGKHSEEDLSPWGIHGKPREVNRVQDDVPLDDPQPLANASSSNLNSGSEVFKEIVCERVDEDGDHGAGSVEDSMQMDSHADLLTLDRTITDEDAVTTTLAHMNCNGLIRFENGQMILELPQIESGRNVATQTSQEYPESMNLNPIPNTRVSDLVKVIQAQQEEIAVLRRLLSDYQTTVVQNSLNTISSTTIE